MAAVAATIDETTGFTQLLSLVWMELSMAALAVVFYVAVSGKMVSAKKPGNAKFRGHASSIGTLRGGSSWSPVAHKADGPERRLSGLARRGRKKIDFASECDGSPSDSDRSSSAPPGPSSAREVTAQTQAMRGCGKSGDLAGAIAIYERMKRSGHSGSILLINTLLDTCIGCGELGKAQGYFEQAMGGSCVNVVSYNTMMKGYLAQGRMADAEGLLQEIAGRGMAATPASYHGLMQARLRMGDHSGAWELVERMQHDHVAPNAVTCAIMLRGSIPASPAAIHRGLQMVQAMTTPMDELLFASVVQACVVVQRLDILSSIRATFAKQGGSCGITAVLYGTMIRVYGKAQDVSTVWDLWREMRAQQVKLTSVTVGCMVEALVFNRSPDDAWSLVQELWDTTEHRAVLNTVIYSTMIKGFVNARQPDRVVSLYEEMCSRAIPPNAITYNTILNAFAQCKAMHRVPELLQAMREAEPRVEPDLITYSTIIKGYCANGDVDKALELLQVMKADARLTPDEVTYNSLLNGCAKQQRLEAAVELVSDMTEAGVPASNFTLSILVKLLGRRKLLDQAFETVAAISKQYAFGVNVEVYTCLVQACFNNQQPSRALALHEQMLSEGLRLDEKAYTSLLRGFLRAGSLESAVHMVRHAYGLIDGSRGAAPGVEQQTLGELMEALTRTDAGSQLASEISSASRRSVDTGSRPCWRPEARSQRATPNGCSHSRRQWRA